MSERDAQAVDANRTTILFRPIGRHELALVAAADYRAFPPRKPEQPLFYPVLQEAYATQIARDWNPKDEASGYAGYVTRFRVRSAFLARYEVHTVGSRQHQEYWIPAEDLDAFNAALTGPIEVIASYEGDPPKWDWRALNRAVERVLLHEWDPIGVQEEENAQDDYDNYAPEITRLIMQVADDDAIAAALQRIERDSMGFSGARLEPLRDVVAALRSAAASVERPRT